MGLGAVALLGAGAVACAALLFAMGSNDVAAVAATGPPLAAVAVAAAFEFAGAFLKADDITASVPAGVAPRLLADSATPGADAALSLLCALVSSALVVGLGTLCAMPVATLHAVVGGLVGVSFLSSGGFSGISWGSVHRVAASWLLSPLLGGLFAVAGRYSLKLAGFTHTRYMMAVPALSGVTAVASLNLVALSAPSWLIRGWYSTWFTATGVNLFILVSVTSLTAGFMRRNTGASVASLAVYNLTEEEDAYGVVTDGYEGVNDQIVACEKPSSPRGPAEVFVIDGSLLSGAADDAEIDVEGDDHWAEGSFIIDERAPIFRVLLAGTTAAIAFAHGSVDVSLGTAPFTGILRYVQSGGTAAVFKTGGSHNPTDTEALLVTASVASSGNSSTGAVTSQVGETHGLNLLWSLGAAMTIVAGLVIFGHGIGITIGEVNKNSKTSHARSFTVNLAVVLSMLCCKWLNLPLSTSYCIVSSNAVSSVAYVPHTQRALERVHEGLDVRLLSKMVVAAAIAPLASSGLAGCLRLLLRLAFSR